jgi:putative sterol carrier protein
MFKDKLGKSGKEEDEAAYIQEFRAHFAPQENFQASYLLMLEGRRQPLYIAVSGEALTIRYGQESNIDIYAKLTPEVMESILEGHMTFQRAFMTGEMTAKGNFKTLRMLDTLFNFAE